MKKVAGPPLVLLVQKTASATPDAILVRVDRHTLATPRWRAVAEDGTELAVNLAKPVGHRAFLDGGNGEVFQIEQDEEKVIVIKLPGNMETAAKVGWYLGNQHLPVEIKGGEIIMEEGPTVGEALGRIGIPFTRRWQVFQCRLHSHDH